MIEINVEFPQRDVIEANAIVNNENHFTTDVVINAKPVISGVTASVDNEVGTPYVDVTPTGTSIDYSFDLAFHNLKGDKGDTGEAATIQLGTVTTGAAGSDVIITNSGTENAAVFNFTIPRGDRGEQGEQGIQGETGNGIASVELTSTSGLVDTYTITFTDGTTTTFDVTNGKDGIDGQDGNGIASIQKTSTSGLVDTYTITFDNGNTETFTVTNGQKGDTGNAATISVGSTTTGAAGTSASVTNSGTSSAAVLDFVIPQGVKGETGATGADGYSPTATVTKSGDTATITITDKNGTTTATISDGSGASSISQLTDVDLTNLADGDVLVYDSTSQEWKAEAQSGGVTDVEVDGESVVTGGVAEINLTGYQEKLTAGTDLEIIEGSTLPSGYTELTSITSTGTQWINSGIKLTNNFKSIIVGRLVGTQINNFRTILGAQNNNLSVGKQNVLLGWGNATNGFYTEPCTGPSYVYSSYPWDTNTHTFTTIVTPTATTLNIDGVINTVNSTPSITGVNLAIFARLSQNNTVNSQIKFELNSIELYQSNVLVFKGIPAQRNADGEIGLYEAVSGTFLPNSGTGTFTAGSVVPNSTVINFTNESGYALQADVDNALNEKQDILTAGTDLEILNGSPLHNLPSEYTELEYIQSSGTQYLDTGIACKDGLRVEVDFQYISIGNMAYTFGFNDYLGYLFYVASGVYTINTAQSINYSASIYNKNHISATYNLTNNIPTITATIGNETKTFTRSNSGGSPSNLWIFAVSGQPSYPSTGRCYGVKVYDNDVLVMELVPAIRIPDNKVGMYDIVGNTFKINSGTGNFIASAPAVEQTIINFTNDTGYITGIDSTDVTTALGYTPYNATNPNGYTSNVGTVTSVNNELPDASGNVTINLNGKADVDGSNMVNSVKNFDGGWVHSMSYLVSGTTSLAAQTSRSFDLSSYLPNDNYQYEVIVSVTGTTSTISGQTFNTWFKSDIFTGTYSFVGTRVITRTSSSMNSGTTVAIPVGTGRSIAIYNGSNAAGSITELWLSGYRRIGTNQ